MQPVHINPAALIVAALLRTVIGALWYSPVAFGPAWMAEVQCNEAEMKRRLPRALVVDVLGNIVMAFVLIHAVSYAGAATAAQGAGVGFFNWLGFVMVAFLFTMMFEGRSFKLFALNNGFQLLSLLIMGAIVAVWR